MTRRFCPGPVNRRDFLQIGTVGLGGLALPELLAAREASGNRDADTSVIMVFLNGGPSQLETYDLKPDAPTSYRSIFNPIATNVPGIDMCELFPKHAQMADRFSLVRSLHHEVGIHSDGNIVVQTGKQNRVLDPTSQSKSEHPDFGMITSHLRGLGRNMLPAYIGIPSAPGHTRTNYLSAHHRAMSSGDPNNANYNGPIGGLTTRMKQSLGERKTLLQHFDRFRTDLDNSGQLDAIDQYRKQAFDVLTSPHVAKAFNIRQESDAVRNHYGRNLWGQGCLLARRLVEAGTAATVVSFNTPRSGQEYTNWDDHIQNAGRPGHFAKYMRVRLPYMDQAVAALVEDIHQRGLDKKVLLVIVGEFGRTPRLSHNSNGTGRNHWPQAYTALISGGGLKMGRVIGSTNSKSEYPTESPHTPQDLLATIYRHLKIDPSATLSDHSGRPVYILESGRPIDGLS